MFRWGRSLLSRLAYGYDPKPENDRRVWLNKELEQLIADVARPGAYLVDTFPFCTFFFHYDVTDCKSSFYFLDTSKICTKLVPGCWFQESNNMV